MSLTSAALRTMFKRFDIKRDKGLTTPEKIERHDNLDYWGDKTQDHLLDVYYPKGTGQPLPIIVSVHGGGWVYGDKETYQFYCMNLAQYGFTVVNFNYRLAPKHKFPAALEDVNAAFQWVKKNAEKYHMDLDNLFVVGDSAGAQLASQYAAILTNANYANMFDFKTPEIKIRAMALNCGWFDPLDRLKNKGNKLIKGLLKDYLGKDIYKFEKEMDFQSNIVANYPPVFVMCSVNDRLVGCKPVFVEKLKNASIPHIYKEYGHSDKSNQHVFHLDIKKEEAAKCNKEQIEFFSKYIVRKVPAYRIR